jgi:hypothetical protein
VLFVIYERDRARANAALAVTWPYCALSGEPSLMMRNHAERVSDKK